MSLFIALFFVSPHLCLCSVKDLGTAEKKENKHPSSHCHDQAANSDASNSKKKNCCGDEGHICAIDLVVESKDVVKRITQRVVDLALIPFISSQLITPSFVLALPPNAFTKEFYLRPNPRPIYIQNQTFLI
ncbi:MAG TPA: hypothetical protein PKC21_01850 [Oligoflexia bacterium]|nr:hypothetical protein [Oligoflexia bacterium]